MDQAFPPAFEPDGLAGIGGWIDTDPDNFLVQLERNMVAEGGLAVFMELAWHVVEGG